MYYDPKSLHLRLQHRKIHKHYPWLQQRYRKLKKKTTYQQTRRHECCVDSLSMVFRPILVLVEDLVSISPGLFGRLISYYALCSMLHAEFVSHKSICTFSTELALALPSSTLPRCNKFEVANLMPASPGNFPQSRGMRVVQHLTSQDARLISPFKIYVNSKALSAA